MPAMSDRFEAHVTSSPGATLDRAAERLRGFLDAHGVGGAALYTAELATEEIGTNILKYAFPTGTPPAFRLGALLSPDAVRLVFEDRGYPFDPVAHPVPIHAGSVAEATIGGLGVHMIRKAARAMVYTRDGDINRLEIVINRTG